MPQLAFRERSQREAALYRCLKGMTCFPCIEHHGGALARAIRLRIDMRQSGGHRHQLGGDRRCLRTVVPLLGSAFQTALSAPHHHRTRTAHCTPLIIQAGSTTSHTLAAGSWSSSTGTPIVIGIPGALFTPADVFFGRVAQLADNRQCALDAAYEAHAERFEGQPCACHRPRSPSIPSTRALPRRASRTRLSLLTTWRRTPPACGRRRQNPCCRAPGVRHVCTRRSAHRFRFVRGSHALTRSATMTTNNTGACNWMRLLRGRTTQRKSGRGTQSHAAARAAGSTKPTSGSGAPRLTRRSQEQPDDS